MTVEKDQENHCENTGVSLQHEHRGIEFPTKLFFHFVNTASSVQGGSKARWCFFWGL